MTETTDGSGPPATRNPYLVAGAVVVVATVLALTAVDNPLRAALAQSVLPLVLGASLVAYGVGTDVPLPRRYRQLLCWWIAAGVLVFTLVGVLFFVLSVLFETAYLLAVVGSLSTGATLGAVTGTYAVRLRQANEQLSEQNERLEEFASIVSHDLRNPLNVASGMVELADGGDELDRAAEALERIDHIIDDVLTLTRDVDDVETATVELQSLAVEAWETVQAPDATLTIDGSCHFEADDTLTRELLENLFRNAVEHGDDDVTVRVGPIDDTGRADGQSTDLRGFYVADDGPGIPDDERDSIFETGYTTGDGTGLGLHIVQRICSVHGWSVTVADSQSGGARFDVVFVPDPGDETGESEGPTVPIP